MSNTDNARQLFRDPAIEPTSEVLAAALGAANDAYVTFTGELRQHDIDLQWRYYTDGNAWLGKGVYERIGARGGKKEITAFWLSIWDGFFRVCIYMPEKARADALRLPLDGEIKDMVAGAEQMGKLKFFPLVFDLTSDELFDPIYILVDFRKCI